MKMRVALLPPLLLLAVLALAGLVAPPAAQEDSAPADPPTESAATEDAAPDAAADGEADEPTDGAAEPAEDPEAAPTRRPRPQSEQEEREYKLKRTREDPFINPPPPGLGTVPLYNPASLLSDQLPLDTCRYIVQDGQGGLAGLLTMTVERQGSALGEFVHVSLHDTALPRRTELWLYADTFKPRRVTMLLGGLDLASAQQRILVDYYFDRVTIDRSAGVVATQEQMRQLPYSFDSAQLPLLLRMLDFSEVDWPFEAVLTDPDSRASLQLSVAQPRGQEVQTAEPQTYTAHLLSVRLGERTEQYWVERRSPHRLLKFTSAGLTYTLNEWEPGR